MTWNNRIFKHNNQFGEYFSVHECYYNEDKQPWGWTNEPIRLDGFETVDELIESLKRILVDIEKNRDRVLDYDQYRKFARDLESPQH